MCTVRSLRSFAAVFLPNWIFTVSRPPLVVTRIALPITIDGTEPGGMPVAGRAVQADALRDLGREQHLELAGDLLVDRVADHQALLQGARQGA